jgi:methylated-DNA-[protein]-cysteine S-methyltransferase
MKHTAVIDSPVGKMKLTADVIGLTSIQFLDSEEILSEEIPNALEEVVKQLREYFDGKRRDFNLRLSPQGTDFQKRVWKELEKIPFGKTVSYKHIATRLGDPKVIRAAASANGKNPIPIIIPCHRVIGSDGSLTGYAGGLYRKKWLLEHENPSRQQVLF